MKTIKAKVHMLPTDDMSEIAIICGNISHVSNEDEISQLEQTLKLLEENMSEEQVRAQKQAALAEQLQKMTMKFKK